MHGTDEEKNSSKYFLARATPCRSLPRSTPCLPATKAKVSRLDGECGCFTFSLARHAFSPFRPGYRLFQKRRNRHPRPSQSVRRHDNGRFTYGPQDRGSSASFVSGDYFVFHNKLCNYLAAWVFRTDNKLA